MVAASSAVDLRHNEGLLRRQIMIPVHFELLGNQLRARRRVDVQDERKGNLLVLLGGRRQEEPHLSVEAVFDLDAERLDLRHRQLLNVLRQLSALVEDEHFLG